MIIKKLLTTFTLILASSLSLASEKISYSGRLTEANGAPISGPVSINLEVVTSTPAILCTITDAAVPLSNGVFHLEVDYATTCSGGLSLKETISNSVAASEELFIRVVDNTNSKTYPSQAITSTPLAVYALEAASVRAGSLVNTSLSGVAANCANNEVIAGDGSGNFKCISASTGSVTSVATGTGLTGGPITSTGTINIDVGVGANQIPQLDGSGKLQTSVETDPSVEGFAQTALPTCGVGEVLKSNGTVFSCVTDDTGTDNDTTYTAGLGIDLTAGQFSIDASACAAGQRMIFGAPGFGCEDADAISLQGNDVDNSAPSDNDVLTWNNATSKWEPRATASTVNALDDLSDVATTSDNLFLGHSNTMGTSNTGVGITSLDALTTGNFNTSLGDGSLTATTQGSNNVALGYNAGASNLTGSGNVFLGNAAGENETGSNKLYIDNSNTATPLIHGDFATDNVTINGTLTIVDGSQAANKVLTSDANGLATWSTLSGAGSVTSVDVTAPLVKAGTASDVDLSIPAATTTVDGYLTSTDWNTFDDKQDALPTGGTTGQVLVKTSGTNYATHWDDAGSGSIEIDTSLAISSNAVENGAVYNAIASLNIESPFLQNIEVKTQSNSLNVDDSEDFIVVKKFGNIEGQNILLVKDIALGTFSDIFSVEGKLYSAKFGSTGIDSQLYFFFSTDELDAVVVSGYTAFEILNIKNAIVAILINKINDEMVFILLKR